MNVFQLRDRLIADYSEYARSFTPIADERIGDQVAEELEAGLLWPESLIQLNPGFEPGGTIDSLVEGGVLHQECKKIFRLDKGTPTERSIRLHKHQVEAIEAARSGGNYVLTTGTGSGKSLAYIVPIVDAVLRRGPGQGVQAIVVYPMNALANSQMNELHKFLNLGYPDERGPVRFARYTGQESDEERNAILADPPDIILTNYVMLELILTRPFEKKLIQAAKGLRFFVLDELHTYRGRQGADVALLARRVRNACEAKELQYVGTSATMASVGRLEELRLQVAHVATQLFGATVNPEHVIGETLQRVTPKPHLEDAEYKRDLKARVLSNKRPTDHSQFVSDPLSMWIESAIGIRSGDQGLPIRQFPRRLLGREGVADDLATLIDVPPAQAGEAIRSQLLAGYDILDPETGFRVAPFRIHQFISGGETVYASLEHEEDRYITTEGQRFVPGDRNRILLPLAFCRECGQEYYMVRLREDDGGRSVGDRSLFDFDSQEGGQPGFIYISEHNPWPTDTEEILQRLPDDWLEDDGAVKKSQRKTLPQSIRLDTGGSETEEGVDAAFLSAPFRFCLRCEVAYAARSRSDYAKLATLGTGGRSTATTILSLAVVRGLRSDEDLTQKARKLLSFTDNRQDASLQAGHFNDFIQNSLLRSALYKALSEVGEEGLSHDILAQKVFDALDLPLGLYAVDPNVKFAALSDTQKALRNVIGYRVYRDLMRGWRVTSPNLEQCGLLQIEYRSLDDLVKDDDTWQGTHPILATAAPDTRGKVAKVLLDFMRRELAIRVDYLDEQYQEQIKLQSSMRLLSPWAIDDGEDLEHARVMFPRSRGPHDYRGFVFLSSRSGFGQFLRRRNTFPGSPGKLTLDETGEVILDLLEALRIAGLVEVVAPAKNKDEVSGYQIPASALSWKAGDGTTGFEDPIRVPRAATEGKRTNPFFVRYYKTIADDAKGLEAREHTAQVPPEIRQEREDDFREAKLPILFCSPTMELGVDIAELNVVNMRNVPPSPANYAQRSGRAGRSGQPALVFTYCSTGSPHDQYFFRRAYQMVAGQVAPPRIELGNEDLIRAHVHAVWLSVIGTSLGSSLRDILQVEGENPTLELLPSKQDDLQRADATEKATPRVHSVLESLESELADSDWYREGWLDTVLKQAPLEFDRACNRWRSLYRAAEAQRETQHKIIADASKSPREKEIAKRLRREAESQLELLTADTGGALYQSDFYSYRYFASEGFLPGYNFPRLPLSAYIPGRGGRGGRRSEDEFVSRPRFLAISEFGPRSFLYHEGSRYIINRVILPIDEESVETGVATRSAKWCQTCGYTHPVTNGVGPDLCELCGNPLDAPIANLFRLQNVATKRRDRISSDEEERLRAGFDIRTGLRFTERGGEPSYRTASVEVAEDPIAKLTYASAATIWRINLGWRRQTRVGKQGFLLDTQNGYWQRNDANDIDPDDPMSPSRQTVIPFVEDRKNCLILEFDEDLDIQAHASLQAALKRAIGAVFQLEDNELAAEPLPSSDRRRTLLIYESAEGGAGVLRLLIDDPGALGRVAAEALNICHFDPADGTDLRKAPTARQECEAACYDCLLSYQNQRDHELLDRQLIKPILERLQVALVKSSPVPKSRSEQLEVLKNLCDSKLEERWLDFVYQGEFALPSAAQRFIEDCASRPDFFYADDLACVYIDGSHHEYPDRAARDDERRKCLEDLGYLVIRFRGDEDWSELVGRYPEVFGKGQ